jgi:hypothetical protein
MKLGFTQWTSKPSKYEVWSAENPMIINEVALHDVKLGVWCATSATYITGTIFSSDHKFTDMLNIPTPFFKLCPLTENLCLFQARQCNSSHRKQFCMLFTDRFCVQDKS